jgi:hypothetical protein
MEDAAELLAKSAVQAAREHFTSGTERDLAASISTLSIRIGYVESP